MHVAHRNRTLTGLAVILRAVTQELQSMLWSAQGNFMHAMPLSSYAALI